VSVEAAVPRDFAVDLQATVSDTAPHITLSWTVRIPVNGTTPIPISTQRIHRRLKGASTWTLLSNLTTSQTSYQDDTALSGESYEYWLERRFSSGSPSVAIGYISAGVKVPEVHSRGILLLAIDDTMVTPLAPEIALLKADLAGDGWTVKTIVTPRTGTAITTKALIKAVYDEDPANTKSLYLLGRVPIPYSGNMAPDGHSPDHYGAWPADTYYADMVGTGWTDTSVNNTGASGTRNDNEPGDGKFDQSYLPSAVELEVGRVDLAAMNRAPSSSVTEISRLRRYLRQSHQFRHKLGAYADIPRRSIIRDGFGHFNNSEAFSVQGWATAFTAVGPTVDTPGNNQWFTSAFASGKDYLFGHACGGGSSETASNFGSSRDFGTKASRVVFTSLFGSYFGDFGYDNNLMRAAICGNADGTSLGLTCFWSGRPNWFTHHPGLGETWGYAAKASMNGGSSGGTAYVPLASFGNGTHIALMGDPALRMHMTTPPRGLAATSSEGNVSLAWAASTESAVSGYHVYRSASPDGPFTRLTTTPVTGTGFTDTAAPAGGALTYLVKTLRLDSVPGGSFYNLSVGSPVTITPSAVLAAAPANPSELEVMLTTPKALVGFHKFDDATVTPEPADVTEPGFTATITKSTDSRAVGGSDDAYYGDSKIKSPNASDGFLRMTGNFTMTVNHGGTSPEVLDALLLDAVTLSAGSQLNVSYSVNGGAPVLLTPTPLALGTSIDSTAVQPYGDFSLPISGVTLNPQDTIVFTFSLAVGSARVDNIALAAKSPYTGTTLDLTWTDNSSDETGFRIERKNSPTGSYTTIGTVPANTTRYTDTSVPYQAGIYFYRVTAVGTTDSTPSNETFYEPMPGFVDFDEPLAKYNKATGTASIPVSRGSGSHGQASVSFATSNSSATAGTHFTTTTGTLTWQDGETGIKYINVPLLTTASFARQFKVTLSNPTNGMGLGVQTSHSALIEDPAATLAAPWTFNTFGTVTYNSPATTLDGAMGDNLIGGTAPVAAGTAESGHLIHQLRTGDGSLVMRVRGASPGQTTARYGVMVRSSLATNSPMAVTLTSSNTSFGTKFLYRATTGAATVAPDAPNWPNNVNTSVISNWVRITRIGDRFISEVSADGNTWTWLASQTISGFPAEAYWCIYHCSDPGIVDYQLAVYENVSLGAPPVPGTPAGLTIASATANAVSLNWTQQALASSYQIERRGDDGSQLTLDASTTGSLTDAAALADTSYEYRITAGNSTGNSSPGPFVRATTPPAATAPVRPGFLNTVPTPGTGMVLSWFDASANTGPVQIERKATHGAWSLLHTLPSGGTSHSDTTVLPGVHYDYRVRNVPSTQPSSWATRAPMPSAPAAIAPGTASGYQLWLLANQLPMDESGSGNATAMPSDGSSPLLVKYALGLAPGASTHGGRLTQGIHQSGGQSFATLSFTQPDPLPAGVTCTVERSPDLSAGSWTSTGVTLQGSTTQSGTITSTYRLTDPQSSTGRQFLRLKVTKN